MKGSRRIEDLELLKKTNGRRTVSEGNVKMKRVNGKTERRKMKDGGEGRKGGGTIMMRVKKKRELKKG